jgi:hypothetical protein
MYIFNGSVSTLKERRGRLYSELRRKRQDEVVV